MNEYILQAEATSIPVLPKGQRVEFRNIDEAFEAGWKTCQEYIASCIEPANVEERKTAQWIPSDIPDSILDKCSECGFDLGANTYRYCPMCGAKMEKLIKVEKPEQSVDGVYVKGMQVPKTCCTCPLIVYVPDIKWNENGKDYIGAYCCKITGELIDNTKREEHCPIRVAPDTQDHTLPDEITPPFGSRGDSITIDEIQKKYREHKQQTFSNLQSEVINPGDNCWARLPCGICRQTMMNCPLSVMQPAWTCYSSTATNQTGGEEK